MRLPPEPTLIAALRWLEVLPTAGGHRRAQALLTTHPSFSDLTPTQYGNALTWLTENDLLDGIQSSVPPKNRLLGAIFERTPPVWVRDADIFVQGPGELPLDIIHAGSALGMDASAIYDQLVASWGKVDVAMRVKVGEAGEAALVSMLREDPKRYVEHVSMWSDGFGYDIAVTDGTGFAHLEVKSTTRTGRFTAYLSRHEYRTMLRDKYWSLVAVRLNKSLDIRSIGTVSREWITENAPVDGSTLGSWASCRLEIPAEAIRDGIPQIAVHSGNRV